MHTLKNSILSIASSLTLKLVLNSLLHLICYFLSFYMRFLFTNLVQTYSKKIIYTIVGMKFVIMCLFFKYITFLIILTIYFFLQ
jgi:hypothetical protein